MKKIIIPIIAILILFIALFAYLDDDEIDGFIFRMGGSSHFDELNTFKETYSRNIEGSVETIEISLSEDEMREIHDQILANGIIDYSEDVLNSCEPVHLTMHNDYYYFMTYVNGDVREFETSLDWGGYSGECQKMSSAIKSLKRDIYDIVSTKEGYDNLPDAPMYE